MHTAMHHSFLAICIWFSSLTVDHWKTAPWYQIADRLFT
jgi:hypothetical protein